METVTALSAMPVDDIPLFSPAGAQAWRAYHCSKKLMLLSLILDD
jgi:hypothetical protein